MVPFCWLLSGKYPKCRRALLMTWSDLISGSLIMLFAILSLKRISWAQWANAAMGTWLMFAPLLFWSPSPASYGTGLLVGGLVIAFSVLVPMTSGMSIVSGMTERSSALYGIQDTFLGGELPTPHVRPW